MKSLGRVLPRGFKIFTILVLVDFDFDSIYLFESAKTFQALKTKTPVL